jgi:uncharacterized membrane protein required for colicin V production
MNMFDLTVVFLVVLMGISGFREGLVRGVIKLAGFVILLVALAYFADPVTDFARSLPVFPDWITVPFVFIGAMIVGMVVFGLIGELASRVTRLTPLEFIDQGFGLVLGVLKALLVAGIIAFTLSFMPRWRVLYEQFATSRTGPELSMFAARVVPFVASAGKGIFDRFNPPPEPPGPRRNSPNGKPPLVI